MEKVAVLRQIAGFFLDEEVYQYAMAFLFAMGILSKCIINGFYINKLEQAKNIPHSNDKLLKKICVIYENNLEIKGSIRNVEAFVKRSFLGTRIAGMKISSFMYCSELCKLLAIIFSAISAIAHYLTEGITDEVIMDAGFGIYCILLLTLFERVIDVKEKQEKLEFILVDYLENVLRNKKSGHAKKVSELNGNRFCYGQIPMPNENMANCTEKGKNEEEILTDIVNDYL